MTKRITDEVIIVGNPAIVAKIHWDAEWGEFTATFNGETYHTDGEGAREDACNTAAAMIRRAHPNAETMRLPRNIKNCPAR